jgi:predicted amidohydrolase YtcJ
MAGRITAYLVALIVGTTFIAGLIVGAQRDDGGPVDLIVLNGKVYTADGQGTMAEAVAVQGNKILKVGTSREIQRLRRAQTVVVDAKGGAVLPGFNDAHTHLLTGGLALAEIDLADAKTLPDVESTIRNWAELHIDRPWVTGRGWYYDSFAGGLPTRQILDGLSADRPAYLTSYDGHTGWANTKALKLAGITRRTPNPAHGTIVKDPRTGEPTGVLKEAAMGLVTAILPRPSREDKLAALRSAITQANRHGITSLQNAGVAADDLNLYEELRQTQGLDVRVYAALSASSDITAEELDAFDQLRAKYPDDPLFKTGAVKVIEDGVIESHTAAMLAPYVDEPSTAGEPRLNAEALDRLVTDLDKRGWQILIHAIGDRAVRMGLDAFARAATANATLARERRHRLEHIETIDPADIPRFAKLSVIASMQPYHSLPDPALMPVWTTSIGEERASRGWMFGSIAKAGGRIAFGSDWPVVTMDPILGIHVAVNRTTPDGVPEGGWLPGERLTVRQAVDAYTRTAAWASFDEHRKGSLERDMLADIVVLSKDIFTIPPARLSEVEVALTVFDGRIVYQRSTETDD